MRVIADDLQFPEGPVWVGDGSLLVVEIRRKTLTRVWPGKGKRSSRTLAADPTAPHWDRTDIAMSPTTVASLSRRVPTAAW